MPSTSYDTMMDDFVYHYDKPNTNQLTSVDTYVTAMEYNHIGQLVSDTRVDEDENEKTRHIEYDVSGKVKKVFDDNGQLITEFKYDDRGFRIMKKEGTREEWFVRDASGNIMGIYHKTTGVNELAQIELPIYGSGKIGNAYRQPDHLNFNYELTDHLGNVRATFSNVQLMAMASMELDRDDHESQYFDNLSTRHPEMLMAYQSEYSALVGMGQVGPALTTAVKAGSELHLEVMAKYIEPVGGFDPLNVIPGIADAISGSLNLTTIGETGTVAGIVSNLESALAANAFVNAEDPDAPKAYLQYILFDENYNVVQGGYGHDLVSTAAANNHEKLTLTKTIDQDGYLYVYVANESEINVHFDNLTVSVLGLQAQSRTEYYPFGYVLSEWKHPDADLYRFGYQGQFAERDTVTGWNHFQLRDYDSRLARWMTTDPYGQHFSPYLAMKNNPINRVDRDGGLDDWYKNDATGQVEWFEGSGAIDGWTHLGGDDFTFDSFLLKTITITPYSNTDYVADAVRQGQKDFVNHPVTQGVIFGATFMVGGGLAGAYGKAVQFAKYSNNVLKNFTFEFSSQLMASGGNGFEAFESMDMFDVMSGTRFSKHFVLALAAGGIDYNIKGGLVIAGGHGAYHKDWVKAISDGVIQSTVGKVSNTLPLPQEAVLEILGGYGAEKIGDSWKEKGK
jgi:RHS repeat-associated protein